ncbi:MAG: hypothetical protein ACI8PZ_007402 [Myxococcota bacterium]|jgi:hypothetical protein
MLSGAEKALLAILIVVLMTGMGATLDRAQGLAQNKLCSTERAPGSPGQGG